MLHTFPDAEEILVAVREYLRDEVMPRTEGTLSFHARVAANLLDVLSRELADGPATEQRFRELLASLGHPDEASLALAVRAGEVPSDDARLHQALMTVTTERLAVANPRYLTDDVDDDPRTTATHH